MTKLGEKNQKPFVFDLVETFLPQDEEAGENNAMSDREFISGLLLGLAIVVAAGFLIHG